MTLTKSFLGFADRTGNTWVDASYLVATSNDTTDPSPGEIISNEDGQISYFSATMNVTGSTGSLPTAKLICQTSTDKSNWYSLYGKDNTEVATSAPIISNAATTAVVRNINSDMFTLTAMPRYFRFAVDLGAGTGETPGWTGSVGVLVKRRA